MVRRSVAVDLSTVCAWYDNAAAKAWRARDDILVGVVGRTCAPIGQCFANTGCRCRKQGLHDGGEWRGISLEVLKNTPHMCERVQKSFIVRLSLKPTVNARARYTNTIWCNKTRR